MDTWLRWAYAPSGASPNEWHLVAAVQPGSETPGATSMACGRTFDLTSPRPMDIKDDGEVPSGDICPACDDVRVKSLRQL